LSQSCSVFFCVVSLRLRIISLMVSFNAATSPCAFTVMERVKSPCVTAVATSAMARTLGREVGASWFTFSVRPFHVPAAPAPWPGRRACLPPHFTRHGRHLVAKVASVSVMLLMVSARAAISPWLPRELLLEVAGGHCRHHLGDAAHLAVRLPP
jgi:hypothetical protein